MHAWLSARAPERAAALAPGDRYRVARALEIALAGELGAAAAGARTLRSHGVRTLKVVLDVPATELEKRIGMRVDAMLAAGFVDEAERLGASAFAADAVGYPQALAYLAGASTSAELRALLVRATRRYAKRQATWFRSEPSARALAPDAVAQAVQAELGW
jgi:tRNA dimethylallyltransferase